MLSTEDTASAPKVCARPLAVGPRLSVWPPVALAPMAGVTNYAYRTICAGFGAGLCVSEMVSAQGLVRGGERTWRLARFGPEERPRSIQIFGADPDAVGEAVRLVVDRLGVDHVDLNFGCPVPKVVLKGMGAAVPEEPARYRRVVRAAVRAAEPVPVSVKLRLGMDEARLTFREAALAAEEEGCAMAILHARTASQLYSGRSRWEFVGELKSLLRIPVLGNGDIFTADDALRRLAETGCDGVVVARGALGNPWIFRDIRRALEGAPPAGRPSVEEVAAVLREHYRLLEEGFPEFPELPGLLVRRFGAWYTRGLPGAASARREFQRVSDREDFERVLDLFLAGRSP
ncbi:MAG: tRNA dihydrouridine synthase DusB [Planctomycetota bacterium]